MTGDVARLFTDVSSLRPCYQARYHFLEKAAQNRMNQGPTNRNMSLKYKEQHESRRNINQTHNPKVGGSNPPPATKSPQQLARIRALPYRLTSTLTSTFRSGFPFPVCHLRVGAVNGGQRWSHRFMLETECTSMRKERSGGSPCFWCAQRSGTSAPGCNGDWQSWRRRPGCRRETGALSSGFYRSEEHTSEL